VPTNLLILPLLGGFLFVHINYYSRFRSQQLEGYRLLLESAVAGVALVWIARITTYELGFFIPGAWIRRWHDFFPVDLSGTAAGAFLLGITLPWAVNFFYKSGKALDLAVQRHGSNLLRLLRSAAKHECPVMLTLDNRKTYVGFVVEAPNLQSADVYVQILPLLSGYRDPNDLRLRFTYNYSQVYGDGKANPQDFVIILRAENIRTAGFYDPKIPTSAFDLTAKDGPSPDVPQERRQ